MASTPGVGVPASDWPTGRIFAHFPITNGFPVRRRGGGAAMLVLRMMVSRGTGTPIVIGTILSGLLIIRTQGSEKRAFMLLSDVAVALLAYSTSAAAKPGSGRIGCNWRITGPTTKVMVP